MRPSVTNGALAGRVAAVACVCAVAMTGCTGTTDRAAGSLADRPTTTVAGSADTPTVISGDVAGSTSSTLPPPEPTGVPGLDDTDPLCAAWATYSGTVQMIAVAYAFSDMSADQLTEAELIASPSVVDAVERIGRAWPTELDVERESVLVELIGRYQRRAGRAVNALRAAGFDDAALSDAVLVWAQVLRTRDQADPSVSLPESIDALRSMLAAASANFDAANTPFDRDPSLNENRVDAPSTRAYLAQHCPDLASSGVGDAL